MNLRTSLGRVLGLGAAKDGTGHWWAQRVSAVALLLLGLWFIFALLISNGLAYADVVAFIARPLNATLLCVFCLTLGYHSYLGVQVIIEDYVHASTVNVVALLLSRLAHVLVAITAVYAILMIGTGT